MNILLFNNGEILKLADFGLARNINSEDTLMTNGIGTIMFMSPEAKKGNPVPFKSDIFSLGIILHMMLTKTIPSYNDLKIGKFSIPDGYSNDINELLCKLL